MRVGMIGASVCGSLESRTDMGRLYVGWRKVGTILHSFFSWRIKPDENRRDDLLVDWAQHELALGDPPVRKLEPSYPTLIFRVAPLPKLDCLVAKEQQVKIDDPRTVGERLCPACCPLDLLQRPQERQWLDFSRDLGKSACRAGRGVYVYCTMFAEVRRCGVPRWRY